MGEKGVVREKESVLSGFEIAKVSLLFTQQQHQRARGQPLPKHIDLFPILLRCQDLLLLTSLCFETSCTSGVDSFPSRREKKTDVAARVAARVLVVIACEPVNHTISAQMPLGQQLPATAIKCRWYR